MPITEGLHKFGPANAELTVHTARTGAAAKAGHDLVIEVTAWEATLEIGKDSLQPILQDHPELAGAISEKVIERRDHLALVRAESQEEESQTVLSRIRAYFGL